MAGRPSAATVAAMKLVLEGMSPYQAMKDKIAPSTMYRSPLYKRWREANRLRPTDAHRADEILAQLRGEIAERDEFLAQRAGSD